MVFMGKRPELTNHIKELRARDGLTQEHLAEKVGVTRQTIISIEKGEYVPSLVLGMKIAKAFRTTIEAIFILNH